MSGRPSFQRHPENPIVTPGLLPWRLATVFNPAAIETGGKVYLIERAASSLRPFVCSLGLLESEDGVRFRHTQSDPVFTPADAGSEYGSVQDPRLVALDGRFYMTFAYRPFAWSSNPTGVGVPDSMQSAAPGFDGDPRKNQTRSGLASSEDLRRWQFLGFITPAEYDDRDVILFPEKIRGRYAVLRRPLPFVEASHQGPIPMGSIMLSYSDDLRSWTEPVTVIEPQYAWEGRRVGGSTPPILTPQGWLVLYHGVERTDEARRAVVYRLGAMLLDRDDPTRVIARCPEPVMEPETYYEKFGLYIPNVIFPTGAVLRDGLLHLYYGVCDTAIGLATVPFAELLAWVSAHPV